MDQIPFLDVSNSSFAVFENPLVLHGLPFAAYDVEREVGHCTAPGWTNTRHEPPPGIAVFGGGDLPTLLSSLARVK
jgi:hypothetical protein